LAPTQGNGPVADVGGEVLSLTQADAMFAEPGHSAEVFSLIRRSELTTDAHVDGHFDTGTEHQSSARG
jgi:hypothetical protein